MNLELLAFEIDGYPCTPRDKPRYEAFAEAVRSGDPDALEEIRVAKRGYSFSSSAWADIKQAQSAGIYEKPRNEYGGLCYYNLLQKLVVERGVIDYRNRWEIAQLPNLEYIFGYSLSTTTADTVGISLYSERYQTLNAAKRAMCTSALNWCSKNKKTKQLTKHFEQLQIEAGKKRLIQLELW